MDLGAAIKRFRTRPGRRYTQTELAILLHVDVTTVRFWEGNLRAPNSENRAALCAAFGITDEELTLMAEQYPDPESALSQPAEIEASV